MTMKYPVVLFTILSLLGATLAHAQYNQQRGVVLGGLTGAAAGAIIGENNDEAGAGAAIGGVVGAIAGSMLGNAEDNRSRAYYATQQRQVYAQQQYQATQTVGFQDVIAMSRSGVSDDVIITAVQQRGLRRPLEVADIVNLSQNGVCDNVIRAMQQAGAGQVVTSAPVVVSRPAPAVIVHPAPAVRYYHGHGRGRGYYHGAQRSARTVYIR